MSTIGSLNYQIGADTSSFMRGMVGTRSELGLTRRVMKETMKPSEQLGESIDKLRQLFHKELITLEQYNAAVQKLKDGMPEAVKAREELTAALADATAITNRTRTAEENHAAEVANLEKHLKAGRITQETYNRAVEASQKTLPSVIAAQKRAADAQRRHNQVLSDARRVTDSLKTPTERYGEEVERLQRLHRRGMISSETYHRGMRKVRLEKMQGIPVIGRFVSGVAGIHPAALGASVGLAAMAVSLRTILSLTRTATAAVKEQLGQIDEIAKAGTKLGMTTEGLVGLRLAASEFSGIGASQFDTAMQRMVRRISEAASGLGETRAAIEELGLDAQKLESDGPESAFLQISDAMRGVNSDADRLRLAFKLFDSEGAALASTLNQGSDAIRQVQTDAEKLGLTFSAVDAAKVEAANDSLGRAKATVVGLARDLTISVAPAIKIVADAFVDLNSENNQFGQQLRAGMFLVGPAIAMAADEVNKFIGSIQLVQSVWMEYVTAHLEGAAAIDKAMAALVPSRGVNAELQAYAQGFREVTDQLSSESRQRLSDGFGGKFMDQLIEASKVTDEMTLGMEILAGTTDRVTESQKAAAEAAQNHRDQITEINDQAMSLGKRYEMQALTFGMTSREAEIFKLQMAGANEETIAMAREFNNVLTAIEDAKKATEEARRSQAEQLRMAEQQRNQLANSAKSIIDGLKSPDDKIRDQIDKLREAYQRGIIDQNQFGEAYTKLMKKLNAPPEFRGVQAAVRGSQEAAAAVARFRAETSGATFGNISLTDTRNQAAGQKAVNRTAPVTPRAPHAQQVSLLQRAVDLLDAINGKTPEDPEQLEVNETTINA